MASNPKQEQPKAGAMTVADNKQHIVNIIQTDTFKRQLTAALMGRLPEDYVLRSALAMVNQTAKLQKCTPVSIAASILLIAQAGLAPEPWKGHAYLIPRSLKIKEPGKPDRWVDVCTALLGYRGYLKLAYDSPKVGKAGAYPVFEGDIFEIDLGRGAPPVHRPWVRPEEGRPERGKFLGAYALVVLKSGYTIVEWMTREDIDAVRERSKAKDDGPWVTDYVEMGRKTAFRRVFTWVPDGDLQKIAVMEEANEYGLTVSTIDAQTGEIITTMQDEPERAEKPAIQQPQRQSPIVVQGSVVAPKEPATEGATGGPDTQPQADATTAEAGTPPAASQQEDPAEKANPFKEQTAAEGQKELTYDLQEPDQYHREANPNGKHISKAQHARLWAIFRGSHEKTGKPTKEELKAFVQTKGCKDTRFIPHGNRPLYDEVCAFAGGANLAVGNGKKGGK
jgi:recombination protein RecT